VDRAVRPCLMVNVELRVVPRGSLNSELREPRTMRFQRVLSSPSERLPARMLGETPKTAFIRYARRPDWLAGHLGLKPANPSARYMIGMA
jgi:hypothetical protein